MFRLLFLAADLAVVALATAAGLWLRFGGVATAAVWNQWTTAAFLIMIYPLLFYFYGAYDHLIYVQRLKFFFTTVKILLVGLLLYIVVGFMTKYLFLVESRAFIFCLHVALFLLFFALRVVAVPGIIAAYFAAPGRQIRCRFAGPANVFRELEPFIRDNPVTGMRLLPEGDPDPAGELFIASDSPNFSELYREIIDAYNRVPVLHVVSGLFSELKLNWEWGTVAGLPVFKFRRTRDQRLRDRARRCVDVVVSIAALIIMAPLFIAIAVAIKADSRGPVIYKQKRCGRDGREFTFYKFRSMYDRRTGDAQREEDFRNYIEMRQTKGKIIKRADVTRVGRVLRKTSFDELPQFFNVLKGDMGLIGPRPPIPYEVKHYKKWHRDRLLIKPGISGLWQIYGRGNMPCDSSIFLDLIYVLNRSLSLDLKLALRTIPAVMLGKGAY